MRTKSQKTDPVRKIENHEKKEKTKMKEKQFHQKAKENFVNRDWFSFIYFSRTSKSTYSEKVQCERKERLNPASSVFGRDGEPERHDGS